MAKFALIELNSGFVWWVGDSNTCAGACERADRELGSIDRKYSKISQGDVRSGAGGFAVYAAPEGFDVGDGQHPADIAAVEALPLQGFFRAVPDDL